MDKTMRKFLPLAATALALLLGLAPLAATAGETTLLRVSAGEYGATQHVSVGLTKSMLIDLPADVKEVIVSQPGLANAVMRTKRRAFIQGMGPGETNIFFLDASGAAIAVVDISVITDAGTLITALRGALPGSHIDVQNFGGRVVLTGTALSADDVSKATEIAVQFAGGPDSVANLITAEGGSQVMLKVTIAEVSRDVSKELGINFSAGYDNGNGFATTLSTTPAADTSGTGSLTATVGIGAVSLSATLKALNDRGAVRTLAEPTLTALSGQEAEFLAGGQIPYSTTDSSGNTVVVYKDYGIKLSFTPTVKSNGVIGLQVSTEVSEPTGDGAFDTRNAKTSVELKSGMSLAMAGLISDKTVQAMKSIPGLGDIPILGALFRSREFEHRQTELMILVTPYIAQPQTADNVTLPTDKVVPTSDAEAIFLGKMEKLYSVDGNPDGALRGSLQGSVGFVLD